MRCPVTAKAWHCTIKRKSWGYHGGGIGNLRGRTYRQKLLTQNGSGRSGQ
jgi:hypothetical protein